MSIPQATLLLTLLVVGIAGCETARTTDAPPAASGPREIHALGELQPASGVISISGTPGDRLKTLDPDVVENQPAPANGLLGVLGSYDARLAQLDALRTRRDMAVEKQKVDLLLAQAQHDAAEARAREAEARLAEAGMQSEQVRHLKETAAIAREELQSLEQLSSSDPELITPHQLRKQRNEVARAESEVRLAERRVAPMTKAAQAAVDAANANVKASEVSIKSLQSNGPVEAIEKEIAVAEQSLQQSLLWAPGADPSAVSLDANPAKKDDTASADAKARYTVLKVFTKPGELVSQLPVMQLADVSSIECVAEVYEADAQDIRLGQGATITSPAFSQRLADGLRGKVTYIASVVSSPGLDPRNPLAPKDRSIVEVRIAISTDDEAKLAEAATRIGLQVSVKFDALKQAAP
ncbi:MAG: efflux RND transporter periplasmic adaptor subunit [Planctomycetales bacterium]|nr:efflux RND transporter periplasmic adaptor subunit [Planctomycetales bacterium]